MMWGMTLEMKSAVAYTRRTGKTEGQQTESKRREEARFSGIGSSEWLTLTSAVQAWIEAHRRSRWQLRGGGLGHGGGLG
jgi:hypothetical protein